MKVRLKFNPRAYWTVESKRHWYSGWQWEQSFWTVESKRHWYSGWQWEQSFHGDDAYERALFFARALKHEHIEEIT